MTALTLFDFPQNAHLRIAEWDPDWRRKEFNPGMTFKMKKPSNEADVQNSPPPSYLPLVEKRCV